MPVQAYVDDSGGKGQGRYFVMAALVARSEEWAQFSDEWKLCLAQSPAVPVFKMREAANCTGAFRGWPAARRDEKLVQLAEIINRYASFVLHTALDLDAHAKTWAKNAKPFNDPYFWPFYTTILGVCEDLWRIGVRERFEIIFDENVIFGPRVKLWYPILKDVIQRSQGEEYSILPVDPIFRSDDEFLPIQAADLFAWCFRNGNSNQDRTFEWLLKHLTSVSHSEYSGLYDQERMEKIDGDSRDENRWLKIMTPEIVANYRKLLGK